MYQKYGHGRSNSYRISFKVVKNVARVAEIKVVYSKLRVESIAEVVKSAGAEHATIRIERTATSATITSTIHH